MLHNGALALVPRRIKEMDGANVGNHTGEKETCRERQRQRVGGGREKDTKKQKTDTDLHKKAGISMKRFRKGGYSCC